MFCYIAKVTVIGDSRSGKTSIIKRYQDNEFSNDPKTTIGVDFTIKEVDGTPTCPSKLKLQIWDTAGQERFTSVVKLYFRSSYTIVIVFDLTNKDSFDNITKWIKTVRREYEPELFLVIGNKSDLAPVITQEFIHDTLSAITPEFEYQYLETSAKKNHNIDKIFTTIIDHLRNTLTTTPPSLKNPTSLRQVKLISDENSSAFTTVTETTIRTLSSLTPSLPKIPSRSNCCSS